MPSLPDWHWNEIQQVGTDYADVREVERYEKRMGQFRDLAAEDAAILDALALAPGSHVLEIGTGTGHFARAAAQSGLRVTALDVSSTMLQYASTRAEALGLSGIRFVRGGFLTQDEALAHFDAAVSVVALHHLPDLWKVPALKNIHRVLKPGGRFFLADVVFAGDGPELPVQFQRFVDRMPESTRQGAAGHIAREFSTLDWIMEGLLARSGFRVVRQIDDKAPLIAYLCETEQA